MNCGRNKDKHEYILIPAVSYHNNFIDRPEMDLGYRHSEIFEACPWILKDKETFNNIKQGFLTSKNRFVDRAEAWQIALKAKQVTGDEEGLLTSEDLY
jgi:hypothetical protein